MRATRRIVTGLLIVGVLVAVGSSRESSEAAPSSQGGAGAPPDGQAAFATVARVLRHPRCLNCHPSGDRPRIGEYRRLHGMNVQRGATDHGMPGQHCLACHQPANQDLAGVPGAPHWHLAPRSMGWEGLDDHALAEALKDRRRNGNRSLADLLTHMEKDALVGWAWEPGAGLAAPPITQAEFVDAFEAWIDAGAPSPPPGKISY